MKNPLFQEQVAELFEKLSWGYDASTVLQEMKTKGHDVGDLARGMSLRSELPHAQQMVSDAVQGVKNVAARVVAPSKSLGSAASRVGAGVANYLRTRPHLLRAGIGTAVMAPILGTAFSDAQRKHEDQLMDANRDPSRVIVASLDTFLEKKATLRNSYGFAKEAVVARPGFKDQLTTGITGGFASGIGKGLVDAAFDTLGSGFRTLQNVFVSNPRRKVILESVMRSDPVISDAIKRNPKVTESLLEAYGTMVRFAPSLSLDVNAVRSFLREAVMGGAGVNYATIKNLAETEKSVNERHGRGGK